MSVIRSGVKAHDDVLATAEGVRQAAVGAAGATAAQIKAAEIVFYRAALASATTNTCGQVAFLTALRELGVGS
jgi:hypothetical protein